MRGGGERIRDGCRMRGGAERIRYLAEDSEVLLNDLVRSNNDMELEGWRRSIRPRRYGLIRKIELEVAKDLS